MTTATPTTLTTLTDAGPSSASADTLYRPGLTLVYCDGLARAGEQVTLGGRAALLLGRDERLFPGGPLEDPRMSARHAALAYEPGTGQWSVVDRGSKNGTFVNGARVQQHTLAFGDVIRVGSTFVVYSRIAPKHRSLMLNSVGAAMAEVEESLALVAKTDHTVLLLGESGTGKELVAHELHRLSGRLGPFLAVNCASLRGELLESELFGHRKGAFTGATQAHDGLFLRADQGTVFLDEVGEMEDGVQARLLRVLEARSIRPVGATDEVPVHTRVVAATNRAAENLVAGEHLRPDLYARLARWTVTLPSLRERKEDLGVLVRVLLGREGARLDVTPELMAALLSAHWPLNIRGLVNVLGAARIAQPHAERLDRGERVKVALEAQAHAARPGSGIDLRKPPERQTDPQVAAPPDKARIEALLTEHHGNIAKVASALGLTRQSLYRLMERHELEVDRFR